MADRMTFLRPRIITQWRRLRASIDKLELEIMKADSPLPTPRMCEFLVIAEDRRFARHPGVDLWALCRAAWKTYFCNSRQGGSTIPMQLVRTITGCYEVTWQRKITEILLAILLSRYVPKDRLPVLYLWCAYYGWKMNNFRQACSRLLLDPTSTCESDDAQLIARLKYPQPQRYDSVRMRKIHNRGCHILTLAKVKKTCLFAKYSEIQNEAL